MSYRSTILGGAYAPARTSYYKINYTFGAFQPWHWQFRGGNHEIVAHSENLTSKQTCLDAIFLIQSNPKAEVFEEAASPRTILTVLRRQNSGPYYEYWNAGTLLGAQWRWRFRGANHEIVASGEAYTTKQACLDAITLIKGSGNDPIQQ